MKRWRGEGWSLLELDLISEAGRGGKRGEKRGGVREARTFSLFFSSPSFVIHVFFPPFRLLFFKVQKVLQAES